MGADGRFEDAVERIFAVADGFGFDGYIPASHSRHPLAAGKSWRASSSRRSAAVRASQVVTWVIIPGTSRANADTHASGSARQRVMSETSVRSMNRCESATQSTSLIVCAASVRWSTAIGLASTSTPGKRGFFHQHERLDRPPIFAKGVPHASMPDRPVVADGGAVPIWAADVGTDGGMNRNDGARHRTYLP
jgi:hypothetical protein